MIARNAKNILIEKRAKIGKNVKMQKLQKKEKKM